MLSRNQYQRTQNLLPSLPFYKLRTLLLIGLCSVLLVACGNDDDDGGDNPLPAPTEQKPVINSFAADKPIRFIVNGQSDGGVLLSWSVDHINIGEANHSISLSSGGTLIDNNLVAEGSLNVSPDQATTYTLTATNEHGDTTASIDLFVGNFNSNQTQLLEGQTAQLDWAIPGIDAIDINPNVGSQSGTGTVDVSPIEPTDYTLTIPALNNAAATLSIDVKPVVSATIIGNPSTGTSPLTVRFSSQVDNNNLVISEYQWDFDSDGTVDRQDGFGAPQTYTYTGNAGDTFTATLTLLLAEGDPIIATKIITLANAPTTAIVNASVTNGRIPLSVSFSVNASDGDGLKTIRVDYDGDGTFDDEQTFDLTRTQAVTSFTHTYTQTGLFAAVIEVEDATGATTLVRHNAIAVEANSANAPVVTLRATPASAQVPATVSLSATASLVTGDSVTGWQWDLDGDGTFETTGGIEATDTQSTTYTRLNNFYPRAQVSTAQGTATAAVTVTTQASSLPNPVIDNASDTINTDEAQIASIEIPLTFTTELSVWLEDVNGNRIKTLQAPSTTQASTVILNWDGTNEQGTVVSEGDYYVVVGYTAYGAEQTLDLRESTGGQLSYYRRVEDNPRTFDRLQQPLRINYAVDDPAEVSFFWQISFGARLMTLMERERMGRGQYSLDWNADYPNGLKVSSNLTALMPGIVRYALPDNVIFVKQRPRIEDFTLVSTLIADPRREPIGINLNLSKASTVEMVVADMDKGVDVATRRFADLTAGEHALTWDGKNNRDQYLTTGDYRIGVRSVDNNGQRSLYWFRTQRIEY